ncbi:glycogen synthase GlgA [Aestuariivirga litoralis]|uniref:glycogen synthase GlgA n=1 Tax=Aestuariivirga litoralis TaxID=2650924 RepID=UPI0018C80AC9|nr:glycogen synthase GlgA [Aestuariivirga litoralis]MBG1232150.1 glycogen synthase GlgA [Aestuariivirga litoralis]
MKVLSVASEIFPLIKTGGLADVAGALPAALNVHGVEMTSFVPGYPAVLNALEKPQELHHFENLSGAPAVLRRAKAKGLDVIVLDAPHLFNRPGNPYLGPDGRDWPDNARRFAVFAEVAAETARGTYGNYKADLLHGHDWQAALASCYLRYRGGPKSLLTIHNIAFQGVFAPEIFPTLNLPHQAYALDGVEYYGNVSFLKGGLASATALSTVSPTYAQEICTANYGMGLEGLLQQRRGVLSGIVNGIDDAVWNPEKDSALVQSYSSKSIDKRRANKTELEKRFALHPGDGIIHGVVSRLTWQKGLDIFASLLDSLVESGGRVAVVGTGEPGIEQAFRAAATRHKGRVGLVTAYDEQLSHLVQGGADTMLVPSRFEPCGLTQLYGLRYGCVPLVARVGGLADTVIDANDAALGANVATGIQFVPVDGLTLWGALLRADNLYKQPKVWRMIQERGMQADVSWRRSAAAYHELYKNMIAGDAK